MFSDSYKVFFGQMSRFLSRPKVKCPAFCPVPKRTMYSFFVYLCAANQKKNKDMRTKRLFLTALCAIVCFVGYARTNIPLSTEFPGGRGGAREPAPIPIAYLEDQYIHIILPDSFPIGVIRIEGKDNDRLFILGACHINSSSNESIFEVLENGRMREDGIRGSLKHKEELGMYGGEYSLKFNYRGENWTGDFSLGPRKPDPANLVVAIGELYYQLNGQNATVAWPGIVGDTVPPYYSPKSIEIPSQISHEGVVYNVTGISKIAFKHCDKLVSITLPNTIESIGEEAFCFCGSLENICIPDEVTEIGASAFEDCSALTSIVIPKNVTTIKTNTFEGCRCLSCIALPKGLVSIEGGAFANCTSLSSIVIPDGVAYIGSGAFESCRLTSIELPKNIKKIDNCCFAFCPALTSIVIPEGVESIGYAAFSGCSNLVSVTIPESVKKIGGFVFDGIPESAHIYCLAKEPCSIKEESFFNNYNPTIHVPRGCKEKYRNAQYWRRLVTIIDDITGAAFSDETGVTPATLSEESARYYDLQGRPVDGTQKGILIRNGKKVLVK